MSAMLEFNVDRFSGGGYASVGFGDSESAKVICKGYGACSIQLKMAGGRHEIRR